MTETYIKISQAEYAAMIEELSNISVLKRFVDIGGEIVPASTICTIFGWGQEMIKKPEQFKRTTSPAIIPIEKPIRTLSGDDVKTMMVQLRRNSKSIKEIAETVGKDESEVRAYLKSMSLAD